MVADDYFDLRSRLGAALFSLGRIADLAGLKPSRTPVIKSLVEGLRDPFIFVVAGEVNAGKSTLLNALFGEEFCPSSALPETQRIHYFRYGRISQRVQTGPLLEEITLPHRFLRDFHVVDTPGVNSIGEGHEFITSEFIPRADAVLYCFPATNPWSHAAWEFLAKIHHHWLKKMVLVLQQADLRTPDEMVAIAEHMRSIGRQRLGIDFPVFPVSARLALLARTSGLDKTRLLGQSAFPAFEQQLTRMIAGAAPRLRKLVTACVAGQAILAEVQSKIAAGATALTELTELREQIQKMTATATATAQQQAAEITPALRHIWKTVTATERLAALTERRPFPMLLLGNDVTTETIESRLLPPLLSAVREAAQRFEAELDHALAALWKQPGSSIHRTLEGRVRRPPEPAWPSRGGNFLAGLENSLCEAVAGSGLAPFWQERLHRRRRLLAGLTAVTTLLVVGLILIRHHFPPATIAWLGFVIASSAATGWSVLRRETAETSQLTESLTLLAEQRCIVNTELLASAHGARRINDFSSISRPLHRLIENKSRVAAPLAAEVDQLALSLQTLGRTLHGKESSG